ITVHPPADTPAGSYQGRVVVESGQGRGELPVSCEVLPFTLAETEITNGAFMYLIDLPPGWYEDMKEHGFDAIQFFTWEYAIVHQEQERSAWPWDPVPVKIRNDDGRLALDFTTMDAIMERMVKAGLKGPVIFSLGNDHHLFYERRLAEEFGLKVDSIPSNQGRIVIGPRVSPELDRLFVEGLTQLREHWKEKAWPQELVILIYDEPTERLLERCKNRYDLIKSFWPEVRIYGVVMNRRDWAESMIDQMDIIVTNGGFEENADLARETGKGFWVYGGVRDQHDGRYLMGLLPWRNRASGSFFWMYNYWYYDPDNCAVYMHPDDPNRIVHSPAWEAMREGHDDLRYLATAEELIAGADPGKQEQARRRLNEVRRSLGYGRARPGRRMENSSYDTRAELFALTDKVRAEVIEIIVELSKND
ncbi:MAG TPA: glycoside hydrolase domain-containing protein, partial [Candidatus Glassbacteria bacterium]|nr:glycoside hydrolase domain-containing protein [Candidatus Glassbacteria bacterium]